ncbi:DUF4129 domain-containing protein [Actinopolymorpha alba]|uniref:DUF4129 domain-containing protein n=1 Tax=Actinopolymorpha alba TaxID=533267 RepID=UPI00035F42D5|nr:DUF4129 domain-containing protein [Actinopolymorpha alba]
MRKRWSFGRYTAAGTVAIVVALLAVGALGLGWQERTPLGSQSLSVDVIGPIVGVLVGIGLAFTVVAVLTGRGGGPPPRRRSRTSPLAVVIQGILFLVAVVLLFQNRDRIRESFGSGARPVPTPTPPTPSPGGTASPAAPDGWRYDAPAWSWPVAIGAGFVLTLAIVAIVLLSRRAAAAAGAKGDDSPSPEQVRQVVAAGRAALAELDAPRVAVIGAYAAMERTLGDLGLVRNLADTPTDLLERSREAGLLGPSGAVAVRDLTELFRQARFSSRELPASARSDALAALQKLEEELRAAAGSDTATGARSTRSTPEAGG